MSVHSKVFGGKDFEPTTLVGLLRWRATHYSDHRAYTFLLNGGESEIQITYGELDRRARSIGAWLQSRGLKGERALLIYPPGLDYIVAFYGCLYAGVVAVPAYPPDPTRLNRTLPRLQAIANDARASVALTNDAILSMIKIMRLSSRVSGSLEKIPLLKKFGSSINSFISQRSAMANARELGEMKWLSTENIKLDRADDWKQPNIDKDTIAFLQYTSGSTGMPRGVMLSHENLLYNLALIHGAFGMTSEREGVIWLPIYHDMGLIGGVMQPLYAGVPCTLMSPIDFLKRPMRWLKAISNIKDRPVISGGPNFAYDLCARKVPRDLLEKLDLSHWVVAFSGAEPVRPETIDRFSETFKSCGFRREAFFPCYGLAEATLLVSGGDYAEPPIFLHIKKSELKNNRVVEASPGEKDSKIAVGCGHSREEQKIAIVNPDNLTQCKPGEVGEVWVAGTSIAKGYWERPEETRETFHAHIVDTHEGPFLRTGDMGFVKDGELFITGRIKDLIIIRGRNHYPQDIELTVEKSHPNLRPGCNAVFSADLDGEERLVIVQEVRNPKKVAGDELIKTIRQAVTETHELQPYSVVLIKPRTIPKTSSGKIQRRATKKEYLEGKLQIVAEWKATGSLKTDVSDDLETKPGPGTAEVADKAGKKSPEAASIEAWLVAKVAETLGINPAEIDVREPFASLGVDSAQAVGLAGDLEEWLGRKLPATLVYDYPTIESLAHHLATGETVVVDMSPKKESAESRENEPIAIIGIGCRFPGAKNPHQFWQLLTNGVDAITEVPPDRWDIEELFDPKPMTPGKMYTRWGGFIEDVDKFDPIFFGISAKEAADMDPQQRLLSEVAWEALEDAGQTATKIAGSATGVFIGISSYDYSRLQTDGYENITPYTGTGNAFCIAANRLSYMFDLKGPSMALDTACSSSLVAVHNACQSIRKGECDMAIAGGVNLMLSPEVTINFCQANVMSPEGRCKTFDSRADGYVRGEGAGAVILKPLSKAIADGDRIYAVIRGGAVNSDGRSNGIMAPNRQSQEKVIQQAYEDAGIPPGQVQYVEAHGTGTKLGDPIEVQALGAVISQGRPADRKCAIGSVKTNIGHLEAGAGVAALIKVALSVYYRQLPPSLHFKEPNPLIPFDQLPLVVQQKLDKWLYENEPLIAGVTSLGFGGTNCHLVVAEAPKLEAVNNRPETSNLLPLSAHSNEALKDLANSYLNFLSGDGENIPLADICYTASLRRTHHSHRLSLVAHSHDELVEQLNAFLEEEPLATIARGIVATDQTGKIVFVFPGQGAQWWGMGHELFRSQPVFRKTIEACDRIVSQLADWSLIQQFTADEAQSQLNRIDIIQPALFAIQVALAALWRSWGIQPRAVVGHSMGEVAAAYVAGILNLEDAIKIIFHRSQLLKTVAGKGTMAVVALSVEQARERLKGYEDRVSIAVIAGPQSLVLSGEPEALEQIVATLEQEEIFTRMLRVDVASHNPQVEHLKHELIEILSDIQPNQGTIPFYSTVVGRVLDGNKLDAKYWGRNLREPVRFADAIDSLAQDDFGVFLELNPHPILSRSIQGELAHINRSATVLPSLKREEEEMLIMLSSLGALYTLGFPIQWEKLYPDGGRVVSLPTFPWQRQRYWFDDGKIKKPRQPFALMGTDAADYHPLLGLQRGSPLLTGKQVWENVLNTESLPFLLDHKVKDAVVLPAAAYLEMAFTVAHRSFNGTPIVMENVSFQRALFLAEKQNQPVQLVLSADTNDSASFQIFSQAVAGGSQKSIWMLHADGIIRKGQASEALAQSKDDSLSQIQARCQQEVAVADHYLQLQEHQLQYGESFQGVTQLWKGTSEALGRLKLPAIVEADGNDYRIHPALLDAGLQVLFHALPFNSEAGDGDVFMPVALERIQFVHSHPMPAWSHARIRPLASERPSSVVGDMQLFNEQGEVVVVIQGLKLQRLGRQRDEDLNNWLYQVQWEPQENVRRTSEKRKGNWLIFADNFKLGDRVAEELQKAGATCIVVKPGASFKQVGDREFQLGPEAQHDFHHLLNTIAADKAHQLTDIIYLWGLNTTETRLLDSDSLVADQRLITGSISSLIKALNQVNWKVTPRLYLITKGAQPVGSDGKMLSLSQSICWGLGRVIAQEHPEFHCRLIDLDPGKDTKSYNALINELLSDDREDQVALRDDKRFVARFSAIDPEQLQADSDEPGQSVKELTRPKQRDFRLEVDLPGVLDGLEIKPVQRFEPAGDQVEIEVRATGLNFMDVMNALGLLPGQAIPLGAECSGIIARVGPEVKNWQPGDEVMGLAPASFGSHALTRASLIVSKPATLSFEEAATIPVTFLTAYYGLVHQARLRKGERVLIHAGAGGVGLSAIQIARMIGAEIFATAGSPEKRDYLKSIGVSYVMDSRTLEFADQVLEYTNGKGVDVVLNSLSGEAIPRSLAVVADYGRFVEIGKTDIYQHGLLDLYPFRKNLSYFAVDLLRVAQDRPQFIQELFQELISHFEAGQLKPLPYTLFALENAVAAFRYMAQRKNIGKIVVSSQAAQQSTEQSPQTTLLVEANASYVITGGLGSLGLQIAEWLIRNGAKKLVLLEPPFVSVEAKQPQIDKLTSLGAEVVIARADVSDKAQLASVLADLEKKLPPIKGIVHAAGLLDDGVLLQLDQEKFDRVMKPKVQGSWNLHQLTADKELDFFILFSSAASIFGSPGQANYVAANIFMDSLAHYRRANGMPALAINWAAWSRVGLAARPDRAGRLETKGFQSIAPEKGIAVFGKLLRQQMAQIIVTPINWRQLLQLYPADAIPPFISKFAHEKVAIARKQGAEKQKGQLSREDIIAIEPEKRAKVLIDYLQQQLARVLGIPKARLDVNKPLNMVGMDSLMAIELKNNLESNIGIVLPIATLLQGPSTVQLAEQVVAQLADLQPTETKTAADQPAEEIVEHALSHGQKALWFQYQVNPESIYNMVYAVRIRAQIDIPRMKQAFQTLVRRHDALRSTFTVRDGEPIQQVHPDMEVYFKTEDVSALSDEDIQQRLETEAKQPFNFETGPLMRVWLFSRSAEDHYMLFVSHHIITDLWSQTVLLYELSQIYGGSDGTPKLPPLSHQYKDFVEHEAKFLSDISAKNHWNYWKQQLSGELPNLELPLDFSRPPVQTFKGESVSLRLDAELTQQLKRLGEQHGATIFMTLLAAYDVLLHRYTGQEDIIVGSPTTGRTNANFTNVIGYFVNPVALRSRVDGTQKFSGLLDQVRKTVVAGLEHQDYPFPLIVEKLQPVRDPARTPIFQTMLVLEKAHLSEIQELSSFALGEEGERMQLGGLPLESVTLEQNVAPFDLTLMAAESPRGIAISFTYNIDLFKKETIARMLENFKTLLQSIATNPEQKVAELPLLTDSELKLVLEKFNDTDREFDDDKCIHELFEMRVATHPDAIAAVFEEEKLTYQQLNQRANQLAHYLIKVGVKPETVVGIYVDRSLDMLVSILGVLKAGGAYLPLDPVYPVERLALMLEDSNAPLLITQQKLAGNMPRENVRVIQIDAQWEDIAKEPEDTPTTDVGPDNLAYLIYTSGSTGKPKGTLLQHRGLCNFATAHVRALGVDSDSRWLQFASFSFDASVSEIFTAFMAGGTLYLAKRETILATTKLLSLLQEHQINTAILPPSMLAILPEERLTGLQTVISAGESLPREVVAKWAKNRKFYNGYGPTEATVGPTIYRVEKITGAETSIPIGKPLDNIKVYILDKNLKPVPLGVAGELCIGGVCLARGYQHRPDLTAEKFIPDPFSSQPGARLYRTGDLARFLPDGNLQFLGRVDFQVKIRGFRIELGEIEAGLTKHPDVEKAVVLARKDQAGEDRLVAYIVHDHKPMPSPDQLRGFLKASLPDYMVPSYFVSLDQLPLTQSGKIDRKALPQPEELGSVSEASYVKPRTETETLIAAIWQDVLKLEKIGIHDNFFDLGGHSLSMAKVHSQLCERLQQDISIVELFKYPTIHRLSQFLQQEQEKKPIYEEKQQRASRQRKALQAQRQRLRSRKTS